MWSIGIKWPRITLRQRSKFYFSAWKFKSVLKIAAPQVVRLFLISYKKEPYVIR
jgi:hypothetical protein